MNPGNLELIPPEVGRIPVIVPSSQPMLDQPVVHDLLVRPAMWIERKLNRGSFVLLVEAVAWMVAVQPAVLLAYAGLKWSHEHNACPINTFGESVMNFHRFPAKEKQQANLVLSIATILNTSPQILKWSRLPARLAQSDDWLSIRLASYVRGCA